MHHYRHHIGDYRKDTAHLSLLEHGVYRQMLDMYYTNENPLTPDDAALMRSLCARSADEQQAVKNVLQDFFTLSENGYSHKRCEKEIASLYVKSELARASAKARWEIERRNAEPMRTHSDGNANALESALENDANASKSDANCMLPSNPVTQLPNNPEKSKALSGKPDHTPVKKPKFNGEECSAVLDYLNEKVGSRFKPVKANLQFIQARFNEGATLDEMKLVIDAKAAEWINDPKNSKYLRPETLFNATKYASYAGQLSVMPAKVERGFVC